MAAELWNRCLRFMEREVDERDVMAWLQPLRPHAQGQHLRLDAPNPAVQARVQRDFLALIERALAACDSSERWSFEVTVGGGRSSSESTEALNGEGEVVVGASAASRAAQRLDDRYTFGNFIEGKSNAQARAASLQVAEAPGERFNPLLIYGESGLGKTHLMHAIGNHIGNSGSGKRVLYVGAEKFVRDLITAIRGNTTEQFKSHYRSVDALLIDDIHFFVGKSGSQEEFFHTFNELLDGRQQMVMTCDRYPAELDGLDSRLKSRFTWGLTVPVEAPELETRVAILLNKAEERGVILPERVAFFVAQRVRSNVRELEGTLNRLVASSRFLGRDITEDFARETLYDIFSSYERLVTIDNIKRVVAGYFKIRVSDLNSVRRTRTVARPRQIAMALCKELTQHSLPEIGAAFGKDHTTVMHACRKVRELRGDDARVREDWENLLRQLGG
nr:chromosomal replication initiator protein DnaA [Algiphilus aromaticivorans]